WCMAALYTTPAWGCTINPATARERHWGLEKATPAETTGKVVVVGGGPAGLEAARVAAVRGHDVVLLERKQRLGGQLAGWAALPSRGDLSWANTWWESELGELGVEVRTGVDATADLVLAEQPEAVILATGSRYAADGESGFVASAIPGHDLPHVYTPEQIL